jgi:alpha-mannosidase
MNNYWFTNYAARQGGQSPYRFRYRLSVLSPGDPAEPVRRGWAACDPLYVSEPYTNASPGSLIGKDYALFLADKGTLVVGAKPADDGEGVVLKLLDVSGTSRVVSVWPAAFAYQQARRTNLVEMNGDALPLAGDRRVSVNLSAWGVAAARLFTPRESAG